MLLTLSQLLSKASLEAAPTPAGWWHLLSCCVFACNIFFPSCSLRLALHSQNHLAVFAMCIPVLYLAATELVSLGAIGRDTACAGCISGGWKCQFSVKNTNSGEVSEFFTSNSSFYPSNSNTPTSVRKYTTGKNKARAYTRHVHRTGAVFTKKKDRRLHRF